MNTSSDHPTDEPAAAGTPNFQSGHRTTADAATPVVEAAASEPAAPAPAASAPGAEGVPGDGTAHEDASGGGRIGELEAALEEMREKWLRAEAETQNVRNRAKREVEDARQYAVQKFARDVVEAAENLRRGLSSLPVTDVRSGGDDGVVEKLREGFESVERSFLGILERNGIKATDPTGAVFDANLHQAMAEQPTADHPPGTVIQSWTSSWTLNGRLLKPAMVVVAKAPPTTAEAGASSAGALDRTA